ncbi:Ribosome biogenesis protein [Lecanora helva]
MPQNEYIEKWEKEHGKRLDHEERVRKRTARESHKVSKDSQNLRGLKAKLQVFPKSFQNENQYQKTRRNEKIQMRKRIKQTEKSNVQTTTAPDTSTPLPQYLLDRNNPTNAKALSSAIKNKRSEKAAKYSVPLPKVKGISEEEMFKAVSTGKKTAKKSWKRMITKPTFVYVEILLSLVIWIVGSKKSDNDDRGPDYTRRPVKYERFIRPMGLRMKKAHVTHPELKVTVQLPIISVKKNPQNPMYTQLGVLTKGTIIEVNVSELGIVTTGGKVVWGRWAQVTVSNILPPLGSLQIQDRRS